MTVSDLQGHSPIASDWLMMVTLQAKSSSLYVRLILR